MAPRQATGARPILATVAAAVAALAAGGGAAWYTSRTTDSAPVEAGTAAPAAQAEAPRCVAAPLPVRAALTLVVGIPGVTDATDPLVDRLADIGVGGVMLRDDNVLDTDQAAELVAGLRRRLGDDVLVAIDEEGGRVSSLRALGFEAPSARRLGVAGPEAAREVAGELADLLVELDIDWVMAPVADVDGGPWQGVIGDRSFGGDPGVVVEVATAFADELQRAGIAVTAKHFPGHGGDGDPHVELTQDTATEADLLREDMPGFDALIAAGAEAVMVGHVSYPNVWSDLPASLEPGAYELLRDRGFDGVAVTDALGMGAVYTQWGFGVAPAMAIAAGADVALVNQGHRIDELVVGLVAAVEAGRLDEDRLDEAVAQVLRMRGQSPEGILCT